MKPMRERNLNSSTSVPSVTKLPSLEPKNVSLYVVISQSVCDLGGVASSYASLSDGDV